MYYKVEIYIEADLAGDVVDQTDTADPDVRLAVYDNLVDWLRIVASVHDELNAPITITAVPDM